MQFLNLLAFTTLTSAHFLLNYPQTAGFSDDDEGTAPCGGFSVNYTNPTSWHVGGDSIAVLSTHPAAVWLFRATLDQTAKSNYTNLLPAVSQSGLGAYCPQSLSVPSSWAGQKGVIQVIQDATDGFLYQCAPVNFVAGTLSTQISTCTNATNVAATFTTDAALATITAASSSTASGTVRASATATASAASTSSKAAAPRDLAAAGLLWGVAGLGAVVVL